MRPLFLRFVVVVGVLAVVIYSCLQYRNGKMNRLYAEAAGYPGISQSSSQSLEAVHKLANYRGKQATHLLAEIALHHGPLVFDDTQVEAIRTLGKRNDPEVAVALASLLQPSEGLKTRQAAASALRNLSCKNECIRSVLHYLERISRGDPNGEDTIIAPSGFDNGRAETLRDQKELNDSLYSILNKEKVETLANLVTVYGLGSYVPSAFALSLVSRLQLREACPYLLESENPIKRLKESYKGPRQELETAIALLDCK